MIDNIVGVFTKRYYLRNVPPTQPEALKLGWPFHVAGAIGNEFYYRRYISRLLCGARMPSHSKTYGRQSSPGVNVPLHLKLDKLFFFWISKQY
jgi:hypothetical protein